MKKKLLLIALLAYVQAGYIYSYNDDSFRRWLLQSTDIIVTKHLYWTHGEITDDYSNSSMIGKATLSENIKGDINEEEIIDIYSGGCGAYMVEPENTDVNYIFFLRKENDQYYMLGCYENIQATDLDFIKQKKQELEEIYLLEDLEVRFHKTVDWIISCSANIRTRDACYELEEYSDFRTFHENKGMGSTLQLSPEQKNTLKTNLFKYPLGWEDMYLIDLFYMDYKTETEIFLKKMLRDLPDNHLYFADMIMERLYNIKTKPSLQRIVKDMDGDPFEDKRQRKLIKDFLKAYDKK
jgi:hypothetical protein